MKQFEFTTASGSYALSVAIQPNREALWCAAFEVDSLDGLFDMTPVEQAKPVLDAAIARFNESPDELRPFLAADDPIGLRGNRGILRDLRKKMVTLGGTLSGAVEEEPA